MKLFLSHNSADAHVACRFRDALAQLQIDCYMYEFDVQPGFSVAAKVHERIRESDVVLVLLTRQAASSAYVHQEIGIAKGMNKPIIPLVEHGAEGALATLTGLEYLPFDPYNPQWALEQLLGYVQRLQATKKERGMIIGILGGLALLMILGAGKQE